MSDQKRFEEYNAWVELIARGCKEIEAPPYEGIPSPLPKCKLSGNVCRLDICPKKITIDNTRK